MRWSGRVFSRRSFCTDDLKAKSAFVSEPWRDAYRQPAPRCPPAHPLKLRAGLVLFLFQCLETRLSSMSLGYPGSEGRSSNTVTEGRKGQEAGRLELRCPRGFSLTPRAMVHFTVNEPACQRYQHATSMLIRSFAFYGEWFLAVYPSSHLVCQVEGQYKEQFAFLRILFACKSSWFVSYKNLCILRFS